MLDGGTDNISPVELWDHIMKKFRVSQECERAIAKVDAKKDPSEKERLQREHAVALLAQHVVFWKRALERMRRSLCPHG